MTKAAVCWRNFTRYLLKKEKAETEEINTYRFQWEEIKERRK